MVKSCTTAVFAGWPLLVLLGWTLPCAAAEPVGAAQSYSAEPETADLFLTHSLPAPELLAEPLAVSPLVTYYDFLENQPLTLRLEYLHWWLSGNRLPPLVTSSPADTPPDQAGVLGEPGTEILFGGREVDRSGRKGFRGTLGVRLGHWSDRLAGCELQAHVLTIGHDQVSGDFFAASPDVPVLARPLIDTESGGVPAATLVAYPGLMSGPFALQQGSVAAETTSRLNGAGLALRHARWSEGAIRADWLAGYRYLRFQERLTIGHSRLFRDTGSDDLVAVTAFDSFSTFNDFHGLEIGLLAHSECGPGRLEAAAKLGLGNLHRVLTVRGETIFDSSEGAVIEPGGVLAQPSNLGRHTSDRFVAVPELDLTFRRTLGRTTAVTVGYTLIALPKVIRSGDQIDPVLDFSPAATRPRAQLNDSVLWIQGVNVGLEW